jgi:hypothetical protein
MTPEVISSCRYYHLGLDVLWSSCSLCMRVHTRNSSSKCVAALQYQPQIHVLMVYAAL